MSLKGKKTLRKKLLCGFAGLMAGVIIIFNAIPGLSYGASRIPVLKDVVRVVTFGRFEVKEENYEADVTTPHIEGLINKDLESKINFQFKTNANTIIDAFEEDIKKLSEEYGDKNFHLSVNADYVVKTNNKDILALDFCVTTIEASAATTHHFYNIDKNTGNLIKLESLFKENSNYTDVISSYLTDEMKRLNKEENAAYFIAEEEPGGFEKIKPEQNFYIKDGGNIVICFDEYEVAAGYMGSPEFELPEEILKDIKK